MSIFVSLIASPILLLISLPLAVFATMTTALAFSTLFLRAVIVYAELAAALVQSRFTSQDPTQVRSLPVEPSLSRHENKHSRRKSRRRSSTASLSSNGGSVAPEYSGLAVYTGGGATRDFEGVGGWRLPGTDEEEDATWVNLNSRLELPALVDGHEKHHHRSRTSSSLTTIPVPRSPNHSRARTPTRAGVALSTSPEGFFAHRSLSKSTTALDAANFGKTLLRHKPSSSSGSSQGSARTFHLTSSNT